MKTKLISLTYRGQAIVDPRFSASMLPWLISDIQQQNNFQKLSAGIENGHLEFVNDDFEVQFKIKIKFIIGLCRLVKKHGIGKPTTAKFDSANLVEVCGSENGMLYLLKNPSDPLIRCFLFSGSTNEMAELVEQMRSSNQSFGIPQRFFKDSSRIPQDMLNKHEIHSTPASNLKLSESMRMAHHDGSPSLASGSKISASKSYSSGLNQPTHLLNDIQTNNTQFFEVFYVGKIKVSHKRVPFSFIDDALPKFKAYDLQRERLKLQSEASKNIEPSESTENISTAQIQNSNEKLAALSQELAESDQHSSCLDQVLKSDDMESMRSERVLLRGQSVMVLGNKKEGIIRSDDMPIKRDRSASLGGHESSHTNPLMVEQNRTMVFLVGRSDLRLISPDKKQILLYKDFKDIASCCQGHVNSEYFGIICREPQNDGYIGYVFKCASESVSDDITAAISLAFNTCSEQQKKETNQIFSCELCPMLWFSKLCSDIEGLSDKKKQSVIFRRMETLSDDDQNDIMAKYYGQTAKADSLIEQNQFLMLLLRAHAEKRQIHHVHDSAENRTEFLNQYLGGSTIFKKAKRSLSNSFDHLLKRKAVQSKDDLIIRDSGGSESSSCDNNSLKNENHLELPRSKSFGASNSQPTQLKSPMMDIFMKVGNTPKEKSQPGSRMSMLNRVVTPSKMLENIKEDEFMSPRLRGNNSKNQKKRTKEELCELWRIAIRQIIILKKMECENRKNVTRQSENETKKLKLDYPDIQVYDDKQAALLWENLTNESKIVTKRDPKMLLDAIKNGVPRTKRGDVWLFLAKQQELKTIPIDTNKFPHFNESYEKLLKNLTEHQHAIFIDLGRTFPNLSFYKGFGVGQLGLFNLLKAYSILDPELGYCQGLGFICGILLLHLEEVDAFYLLKHLMFNCDMRLNYLPDMKDFQLQLYQFSRLLKDLIPDLFSWLDVNDVSPTLYAAPWFLTVFSSQFPLGFVVRVFDLLFLESPEMIFRVAIALLQFHKDELLNLRFENSFEKIMDHLKNKVPEIENEKMNKIFENVFKMDLKKQLNEYEVEYHVLQEEISTQNFHLENLNKVKAEYKHLETQLQISENSRNLQKAEIQTIQNQVKNLEGTIQTLGNFISQTIINNSDTELPEEVKKILQQINQVEQQQIRKKNHSRPKIGKSMSVNSHLTLALNILEEANETSEPSTRTPKKFFGNTFESIRQHKANLVLGSVSLNSDELSHKTEAPEKCYDVDSGITTPADTSSAEFPTETTAHPLSNDVNNFVRFNGTMQLKTIRSVQNSRKPANCTKPTSIKDVENSEAKS